MAWVAISLISVVTAGVAVGAAPGREVGAGVDVLRGNGDAVGNKDSVAWAAGEQAASPPSRPTAPNFNASLRDIFLFIIHLCIKY